MVVGILLIPLYRSQAINSLVFVAQGRNLNIVAEACSNDINVFSRIILAAFSRNKLTQAAGSLTYSTMLAIVPLIMVVFSIFSAFPVFNEVTGALKEFIFTNFAPSASDVVGQYIDEFVYNSKKMSAVGIVSLIFSGINAD